MRWPADFYCPTCGLSFRRWAGCRDVYHQTVERLRKAGRQ